MIPTKEMKKMLAFHGDAKIKTMMIKELKWHQAQDAIVQGTYGQGEGNNFKGCAVACSINSLNRKLGKDYSTSDHKKYEVEIGIPETLAYLEDSIFEKLSVEKSKEFPLEFIKAIPVGSDLSLVAPKFIVFVLTDVLVNADEQGKKAIDTIIGLWSKVILGKKILPAAWSAAFGRYKNHLIKLLKQEPVKSWKNRNVH